MVEIFKIYEKILRKEKEMKQLERVYLLNVLIYIKDIDSTRRFLEINHKCR